MINSSELRIRKIGWLVTDGNAGNFTSRKKRIDFAAIKKLEVSLKPRDDFVVVSD